MKVLKLKNNCLGRYEDVSPFPFGDLQISLSGIPEYVNAECRFIGYMNGKDVFSKKVTVDDNEFTIPQGAISAGEFTCEVLIFIKGTLVTRLKAEPLIITKLTDCYEGDPAFSALVKAFCDLRQREIALEEKIAIITETLGKFHNRVSFCENNIKGED